MIQINPTSYQMASDIETRQCIMIERKEFDNDTFANLELTVSECANLVNHWE